MVAEYCLAPDDGGQIDSALKDLEQMLWAQTQAQRAVLLAAARSFLVNPHQQLQPKQPVRRLHAQHLHETQTRERVKYVLATDPADRGGGISHAATGRG